MFFKKKKQPEKKKKQPEKKSAETVLKHRYMEKCRLNTEGILAKLAEKREEFLKTEKVQGIENEVKAGFDDLANYITSINWDKIIDQTLATCRLQDIDGVFTYRVDEQTVKYLLNLQWQDAKDEMNKKINELIMLVAKGADNGT